MITAYVEIWNANKIISKTFKDQTSAEKWIVKVCGHNCLGYTDNGEFGVYFG